MILPKAAVAEVVRVERDEVTDTEDRLPPDMIYLVEPEVFGSMVAYVGQDQTVRGMDAPGLISTGRYFSTPDGLIRIREADPYDAVTLAPGAGVPQPIEAVRAEILQGGGALATELDAVVAGDNTVVTLLLETSTGTYVRYSSDWQRLSDDSTSLEDHALVPVGPAAVDIFDAADAAKHTLSVGELPIPTTNADGELEILDPQSVSDVALEDALAASGAMSALTAAGVMIPQIDTEQDLDMALRFAAAHPSARWYVTKMAASLGVIDRVPVEWRGGEVIPFAPAV